MALGLVADSGRLGFKKRWGRDEGWVVYGFEGESAGPILVFLVCGSKLCGLDWEMNWESGLEWEMKWWEGGSEKWGWSAREMSGIGLRNEQIRLRNGKGKLIVCGEDRLCEGDGLDHLAWGRWWSSVCGSRLGARSLELFHSVCGSEPRARCVENSLESFVCIECVWESRWKMFEVKMRTEFIFRPRSLILQSNWKYFQFDPIFQTYQTCYFPEKDFWILFEVKKKKKRSLNCKRIWKFSNGFRASTIVVLKIAF